MLLDRSYIYKLTQNNLNDNQNYYFISVAQDFEGAEKQLARS